MPIFVPSTAKPYNAEFYFDTPNPVRIQKGNNYSYNLQWTQRDPEATDPIIGFWLIVRKVKFYYTVHVKGDHLTTVREQNMHVHQNVHPSECAPIRTCTLIRKCTHRNTYTHENMHSSEHALIRTHTLIITSTLIRTHSFDHECSALRWTCVLLTSRRFLCSQVCTFQ